MDKHADIVEDRIIGIENDLKTYVDLRIYNRQHQNNEFEDNLGGGNMVMALSLFASLGLLSKVYVCITSNEAGTYTDFFNEYGHAKDEQKLFIEFIKFLDNGYDLFEDEPPSNRAIKTVWECFRDFTTHLLVPDQGNSVITSSWRTHPHRSVEDQLRLMRSEHNIKAFEKNGSNWQVNADKLLSILPDIKIAVGTFMREHATTCSLDCADKVEKILWR
jgi:hypothetical protein